MNRTSLLTTGVFASVLLIAGCGGGSLQSDFHSPNTSSGNSATPSSNFAVTLLPASPALVAGQSITFTSPFIGSVVWKVNGVEGGDAIHGTIDRAGTYTSPLVAPTDQVKVSAELGTSSSAPSASAIVVLQNPAPHLDSLTPATVIAGTTPTIVFSGSGFNPASQTTFNGQSLTTVYNDTNHVSAQLSPDLLQNAGSFDVALTNPSPGGGAVHQTVTVLSNGIVAATGNPQVAAYSIVLPGAASATVDFGVDASYGLSTSPVTAPQGGGSTRVLVAGMKGNSVYHMRAAVHLADGTVAYDQDHTFTTSSFDPDLVPTVAVTHFIRNVEAGGVQMLNLVNPGKLSLAIFDRDGNLIWGYNNPSDQTVYFPAKLLPDGNFLLLALDTAVRETDLSGTTVSELSQDQLQTSIAAAGYQMGFVRLHHDMLKLPNGHYILLGNTLKDVVFNGDSSPTSILGDVLVDIGPDLKVNWLWNSFDHLDVNRHPIDPIDWTHGNAVVLTSDGNLLLSMRHQSWILKLDYQNGTGTGDILWRLGYQGDFALKSSLGNTDWFYLQHYPNILSEQNGVMRMAIFDNGDNRIMDFAGDICGTTGQPDCYSRGIVMDVDQNNMTATVEYQHTLSAYSFWGGSIQQMPNGNYVVGMSATSLGSRAEEFTGDSSQSPVWQMDVIGQGAAMYRSLRLPSLYPGVTWK